MANPLLFDESVDVAATGGSTVTVKSLPFTVPEQEKEEWCWAAVGVGLHDYYNQESPSQCEVAGEVLSADCCSDPDMCNDPQTLDRVLKKLGYRAASLLQQVNFSVIQQQIDNKRPLCCFLNHSDVGHVVVITAYDPAGQLIGVIDPGEGEAHDDPFMTPFSTFRIRYNNRTWIETYLTQPRS